MSFTYGFYNSVNGDRVYDALQFGSIFDGVINDGVYMGQGNRFYVRPASSSLGVTVDTGRAWFDHTWCYNDSLYPLTLDTADQIDPRIDAIVIQTDSNTNTRQNSIRIVKGTPGETPRKPTLTHTEYVNQYPLAYVRVNARATTLTQANIENAVGTSATPFVTGVIQTMNIDTLIAQWQAQWSELIASETGAFDDWEAQKQSEYETWIQEHEVDYQEMVDELLAWESGFKDDAEDWYAEQKDLFDDWFANLRYTLDGDVAGHLQNEIDTAFKAAVYDVDHQELIFTRIDNQTVPVTLISPFVINNSGQLCIKYTTNEP